MFQNRQKEYFSLYKNISNNFQRSLNVGDKVLVSLKSHKLQKQSSIFYKRMTTNSYIIEKKDTTKFPYIYTLLNYPKTVNKFYEFQLYKISSPSQNKYKQLFVKDISFNNELEENFTRSGHFKKENNDNIIYLVHDPITQTTENLSKENLKKTVLKYNIDLKWDKSLFDSNEKVKYIF